MNKNNDIILKLSEITYDSIKNYDIGTVLSVELDILSTKYGELIVKDANNIIANMTIVCHDIVNPIDDIGIIVIFDYNNHRWLEYFKNDKIKLYSGSFDIIREYEALSNKNIGIKCFISSYSENGDYDTKFNEITFKQLKEDSVGYIYSAPIFGNENVKEEKFAILKYRNKFGVVINFVYDKKNDDNKHSFDHWYEWIEFPK